MSARPVEPEIGNFFGARQSLAHPLGCSLQLVLCRGGTLSSDATARRWHSWRRGKRRGEYPMEPTHGGGGGGPRACAAARLPRFRFNCYAIGRSVALLGVLAGPARIWRRWLCQLSCGSGWQAGFLPYLGAARGPGGFFRLGLWDRTRIGLCGPRRPLQIDCGAAFSLPRTVPAARQCDRAIFV